MITPGDRDLRCPEAAWGLCHLPSRWIALLLIVAPFFLARATRADIELTAKEDSGPTVVIADDPVDFDPLGISFNGSFGDFRSTIHAISTNASAASDLSLISTITNTSSATHTLTIGLTQDNFTLPSPSSETLKSAIGGAFALSVAGDSISLTAYANNSNGLFDTVGATSPGAESATSPGGNAVPFSSGTTVVPFTRTSGLYSLTTMTTITLAPGSSVNFGADPVVAVPEPAGLTLLCLGGMLALRRRRAVA